MEQQKALKKPAVDLLVSALSRYNIHYKDNWGILDNVVFSKDGKEVKMCHEMFFRWSGRSVYYVAGDKDRTNRTKAKLTLLFSLD